MAEAGMSPLRAEDQEQLPQHAQGQYELGVFYSDEDLELATFWFGRAARQGHADAMFMLGRMIEGEEGPVRDLSQAERWYRRAAAAGHARAQEEMPSRPPQPQGQLEMAISSDARSQYQMGFAHMMGTGAPKDYAQSYFWFKVLEKTMPAQAAMTLQMLRQRLDGEIRAALDEVAAQWTPGNPPPEAPDLAGLRAAVTLDDAPGCYALGRALAAAGSPDAQAEALEWLVWAAKQGYGPAHYALAFHYRRVGDGQEEDSHLHHAAQMPAPLEILAEGAALGINQCRYQLAMRMAQDPEVEEDAPRTAALHRAAAEEGFVPAMTQLAFCYHSGYGVEPDPAQAEHWFGEAAKHEDPDAL